ncbi:YdeI/OmpD-associated family protein [Ignavibacterium sp.]|uniref:YdeI/OmpD-associated family protein n=1 Tax=Ignavibacterium sp. TaxID=2651167 RepID=UPI00307ECFC1
MIRKRSVFAGVVHRLPEDMKKVLSTNDEVLVKWNNLTPIQRNEWICWVTIVKKSETRLSHIMRMMSELDEGKKQPCCWPGCPHRRPSTKKYFNNIKTKKS